MTTHTTHQYRIKSFECSNQIILTIEEVNQPGELRLLASDVLANQTMLQGFNEQDVARIKSAVASEQATISAV